MGFDRVVKSTVGTDFDYSTIRVCLLAETELTERQKEVDCVTVEDVLPSTQFLFRPEHSETIDRFPHLCVCLSTPHSFYLP